MAATPVSACCGGNACINSDYSYLTADRSITFYLIRKSAYIKGLEGLFFQSRTRATGTTARVFVAARLHIIIQHNLNTPCACVTFARLSACLAARSLPRTLTQLAGRHLLQSRRRHVGKLRRRLFCNGDDRIRHKRHLLRLTHTSQPTGQSPFT